MNRQYGSLLAPEITSRLTEDSILCLPIGSYEQHGPHLPLHTDTVIAEQFTTRLVDRYGHQHDVWALPSIPYGLSLEHAWSPGTISLRVGVLSALLDTVVAEYVRATPARRLLIVNGHGGNRGLLEAITYELQTTHQVRIGVVHPSSLSTVRIESTLPEVHAGMRETSVMLALAPTDVHLDRLPDNFAVNEAHRDEIKRLVLDRGTTWPWTSGDPRIATLGVTGGDPRLASAELGESIIASALDGCDTVLKQL
ncbi:creatininase family protein [Micromonospora globbae]|uniref:creatininase family protein n=1 Tax=Micromonospora globbae TaxID=1894969 RepID=UPI0038643703|nr:creatininase family protein [Micromonospora globbae]